MDVETSSKVKDEKILPKQWEQFQSLKARREKLSLKTSKDSSKKMTRETLKAVKKEISIEDVKGVLQSEGVIQCDTATSTPVSTQQKSSNDTSSSDNDVKKFLTSNNLSMSKSPLVRELEEELNSAIKRRKLDEASKLSDTLAEAEFESTLQTAMEGHKYVQEKQAEEEKRRKRKPKLQWRYEHKQRWEMKSNM